MSRFSLYPRCVDLPNPLPEASESNHPGVMFPELTCASCLVPNRSSWFTIWIDYAKPAFCALPQVP